MVFPSGFVSAISGALSPILIGGASSKWSEEGVVAVDERNKMAIAITVKYFILYILARTTYNVRANFIQSSIDILVAAIYLFDITNNACTLST